MQKGLWLACFLVLIGYGPLGAADGGKVTDKDLIERGGLWFEKSSDMLFTSRTSRLKQHTYGDDMRDGRGQFFYASSQLKATTTHQNGALNGPYEMYFENGQPMMRGSMKNGIREGAWEVFYFNGEKSLNSSGEYRNGKWVGP